MRRIREKVTEVIVGSPLDQWELFLLLLTTNSGLPRLNRVETEDPMNRQHRLATWLENPGFSSKGPTLVAENATRMGHPPKSCLLRSGPPADSSTVERCLANRGD